MSDGDDEETRARVQAIFMHLQSLRANMETTLRELQSDIGHYEHVTALSSSIGAEHRALCHLGHGVHVQAVIPNASQGVHVHVGLGFFVELPWPEAVDVANARVAILQGRVALTEATIVGLDTDLLEVLAENGLDPSALRGDG